MRYCLSAIDRLRRSVATLCVIVEVTLFTGRSKRPSVLTTDPALVHSDSGNDPDCFAISKASKPIGLNATTVSFPRINARSWSDACEIPYLWLYTVVRVLARDNRCTGRNLQGRGKRPLSILPSTEK